jgi:hypothetical protein
LKDYIILTDTRQQKENYIIKEFDKQGILHIRTGLPSADYMALRYNNGFYLDYTTLIDTKKDLEEISGNLCNTQNHERIKKEIFKARELGCKNFIFLIADNKIKTIQDLQNWSSKRTRVKGSVLLKIMRTMSERYGIRFIICEKKKIGKKVIELLGGIK